MSEAIVPLLVSNFVYHIPIYLVWLAGIILAGSTRKRNPKASLFTILAIASMFVFNLISMYVAIMPIVWRERGYNILRLSMMTGGLTFLLAILNACSFGLLLAAIFIERKPSGSADNFSQSEPQVE
jgi:hypothetical protein